MILQQGSSLVTEFRSHQLWKSSALCVVHTKQFLHTYPSSRKVSSKGMMLFSFVPTRAFSPIAPWSSSSRTITCNVWGETHSIYLKCWQIFCTFSTKLFSTKVFFFKWKSNICLPLNSTIPAFQCIATGVMPILSSVQLLKRT